MRSAASDAMRTAPELALIAHVSPPVLERAIPVDLQTIDAFSEPEPSEGAMIELLSGRHIVVIYGLSTERLYVHATWPDAPKTISDFLRESTLNHSDIEWIDPRLSTLLQAVPSEVLAGRS
jgi:hypothetical protein